MTAHIFVDETKAKGYVIAAATLLEGDLAAPRKRVQALVLPRQRSLHMKDESDPRRRQIIDTILEMADTSGLTTAIYDAGREGTELARRAVGRFRESMQHQPVTATIAARRTPPRGSATRVPCGGVG